MIKDRINKFMKGSGKVAEAKKQDVTAEVEQVAAQLDSEFAQKLAEQALAMSDLQAKFDSVVAELANVKEAKAAMEKAAQDAKFAARKEKIVAAVGTAKAAALFDATESLDDAKFEAVVGAMAESIDKEAEKELFKDVGVSGGVEASKVMEESSLETMLKQKYAKNSK